jgi:hypothetical protein
MSAREPSVRQCIEDECQMIKGCFAYESMKNHLFNGVLTCHTYMPPVQNLPMFTKIEHKRKLNDE